MKKKNTPYTDTATVESQRNDIIPEEYPEGPFGAATNEDVLGKETPYTASQHAAPRFTYEDREFHAGLKRRDAFAHPTHDDPNRREEVTEEESEY